MYPFVHRPDGVSMLIYEFPAEKPGGTRSPSMSDMAIYHQL
jgi:hypothetical protein